MTVFELTILSVGDSRRRGLYSTLEKAKAAAHDEYAHFDLDWEYDGYDECHVTSVSRWGDTTKFVVREVEVL